ncbi:MAG: hypothetical protein Q8Q09_02025 [Deltaproteobacteria bacterium]|nr:hypothetical protein [Deltaproteobacteria bacterium]
MAMTIDVLDQGANVSERMKNFAEVMTREVLRGFEDWISRATVRLRRKDGRYGQRRYVCDVRLETGALRELVFEAAAPYPHVAVERALEELWTVLRHEAQRVSKSHVAA